MVHARQSQPHPREKSQALQRRLYLAAKRNRSRRFHALYDRIVRPDVLWRAWEDVRANQGRAGVDGVRIEDMERHGVGAYLAELAADLGCGGFDFLGFHFHKRPSRRTGRLVPYAGPSQKAMKTVREKIREQTERTRMRVDLGELVGVLNRIITGWRAYFAIGNSTKKLADLDRYVWLRLGRFLRKRQGSRGRLLPAAFAEWERRSGLAYFYPKGRRSLDPCTL